MGINSLSFIEVLDNAVLVECCNIFEEWLQGNDNEELKEVFESRELVDQGGGELNRHTNGYTYAADNGDYDIAIKLMRWFLTKQPNKQRYIKFDYEDNSSYEMFTAFVFRDKIITQDISSAMNYYEENVVKNIW